MNPIKIKTWLAILFFVTLSYKASSQEIAKTSFAIMNVNIVPMDENRVLEDHMVWVEGDLISFIGPSNPKLVPESFTIIDGQEHFLMPGLADMHVHLRNPEELVSYLNYGVTTIMHLGGTRSQGKKNLLYNEEITDGIRIGPRIYSTGRIFDGDPPAAGSAYRINEPELAKELMSELSNDGFDFVKVYNNIPLPVFQTIVEEAERIKMPVIGHLPRSFEIEKAITGGLDVVAHSEEFFFTYFNGPRKTSEIDKTYRPDYNLIPDLVKLIKANNVAIMPNLSYSYTNFEMWDDMENIYSDPDMAYVAPSIVKNEFVLGSINRRSNIENFIFRDQIKYNLAQELTRQFQQAGVLQLLATDASMAGIFPGKSAHRELNELVKAGLSNYDALSIGTRNAGEFIKMHMGGDAQFGQIKKGFRADLLLVAKNPLTDIRNAREILGVMTQGNWIKKALLEDMRQEIAKTYEDLQGIQVVLEESIATGTTKEVINQLLSEYKSNPELLKVIESTINSLGYASLANKAFEKALALFELNTINFAESANAWDSYAEAYLLIGDKENAIKFYKKALEVNPSLSSAKDQLEVLSKK